MLPLALCIFKCLVKQADNLVLMPIKLYQPDCIFDPGQVIKSNLRLQTIAVI